MKKTTYYCFLALTAIAMTACSPEDGEPGPAGPQGEPGTANVIYSDWMDIVWNLDNEPSYKTMHIDAGQITDEFIENGGIILMYLKRKDGNNNYAIVPLPYDLGNDRFVFAYGNAPSLSPVGILVQVISVDNSTPVSTDYEDGSSLVRYILIPGGTPLENALVHEGIDITNYREVTDFFNINK